MATYDVEIPGKGTFRVDAPGELTEAQAYRAAAGQAEVSAMADPTAGMSSFERGRAGFGKVFADLYRGGKQMLGMDTDAAASRRYDAPLMSTTAGQVGNLAGNVTAALPALFVPGANTYAGAALAGGVMGALQPTVGNESRGLNAALGAGLGVGGQAAGSLVGRAIRPVQTATTPARQALVQEAAARNIPLSAGQATGSRPLQITESVMEDLPFTSGRQLAFRQGQREAFNRAVGSTFGAPESAITPEVAGAARQKLSETFTDLARRNSLNLTDDVLARLGKIESDANRFGTGDISKAVSNRIDDFLSRVDTQGKVSGTAYRRFDSALGRSMRSTSNGDLRFALGEIRDVVRSAMDESISAADQAAWRGARQEYGNLMTVAPLAARSETGDVSGRTLLAAANAANSGAKFGKPSELATLGRIGRAFVADQIPNSGTAQRQFYRDLLTSGGRAGLGAGAGAGVAAATGNDPLQGAAIGGGVMAAGLLGPRAAQSFMQSPMGYSYLTRGLMPLRPEQLALINAAGRTGAMGLLGYAGQ